MRGPGAKGSISSGDRTYFVPARPRLLLTGAAKRWNVWPGAYLDSDDFERGDLLLMQDRKGIYWWAYFENLFKKDCAMRLHPCSLSHRQADWIVKKRVLLIAESDLRLSDFSLLCRTDKPPRVDETLEKFDLAARHLTSTREVNIFRIGPDGKRTCNEVKTADYSRAKADLRRNPTDTRNMRMFCNRQGSNGEGPSNLDSRVCHGYVRPSWSPSNSFGPSRKLFRRLSCSDSSSISDKPDIEEPPCPMTRCRKHSTAYYIMKLACVTQTKLEAEQHRYELKCARREKKPEGYVPPPRWTMVVKQVRGFWNGGVRKRYVEESASNEYPQCPSPEIQQPESEECPNPNTMAQEYRSPDLPDYASCNGSIQGSTSSSFICDEDITPLTLPAPQYGAVRGAQWVELLEKFPAADVIYGTHYEERALPPRHDSLGEGITCDSETPSVDPGVSTVVGKENVKRHWVDNGGLK
jgi:hypothetical protein